MKKRTYFDYIESAEELSYSDIIHNSVGFVINNAIDKDKRDLYDATTGNWKCSLNRIKEVDYVFSLYKTIIVGIWIPYKWESVNDGTRVRWKGVKCVDEDILDRYLYKKVPKSYSVVRYYGNR